jgi:hypothetical protein
MYAFQAATSAASRLEIGKRHIDAPSERMQQVRRVAQGIVHDVIPTRKVMIAEAAALETAVLK